MNTIECYITRIIKEPYQIINVNYCCWAVDVEYDSYGVRSLKTFYGTNVFEINKFVEGYKWSQ